MTYKTALYDIHNALGAKVVDFHDWLMPIQYSGIIDEHKTVRNNAGLFDLSHMGEIEIKGPDAKKFLDYLTCNSLDKLSYDGRIIYTGLLNENAGFIDDLLIYRKHDNDYLLVVNASNREHDFAWFKEHVSKFNVSLVDKSLEIGLTAIQGPLSESIISKSFHTDFSKLYYYHFIEKKFAGKDVIISRTGYTGEDGFEIYSAWDLQPAIWNELFEKGARKGVKPIGLGARDTLRLESKYPLHGNDIDQQTTPMEAGLSWIVDFKKDSFIGKTRLVEQKKDGVSKTLIGFTMIETSIPRAGYDILCDDMPVGKVTSGTMSPTLQQGIGIGYVMPDAVMDDKQLAVLIHGKKRLIALHKGPFVIPKTYKKS